jgi:hypothetical protein
VPGTVRGAVHPRRRAPLAALRGEALLRLEEGLLTSYGLPPPRPPPPFCALATPDASTTAASSAAIMASENTTMFLLARLVFDTSSTLWALVETTFDALQFLEYNPIGLGEILSILEKSLYVFFDVLDVFGDLLDLFFDLVEVLADHGS